MVTLTGSRAGVISQGLSGIELEEMCRNFIILLDLYKLKLKQILGDLSNSNYEL